MIRDLSLDKEVGEAMARSVEARQLVDLLMALRTSADFSQAQVAQRMGCSQSRVSKLESSDDDDLRVGDVHAYLSALGLELSIVVVKKAPELAGLPRLQTNEVRIRFNNGAH